MPKSLLVIGSGAIGIEFASFYRDMGAEVTVVEVLDRVLPVEDEEISAFARKSFEKQGMKIHTGATVKSAEDAAGQRDGAIEARTARRSRGHGRAGRSWRSASSAMSRISASKAPGRRSSSTHIVVDEWLRTGEPGLYAIGDLVGPPWLAHKAMHEGRDLRRAHRRGQRRPSARHQQHPGLHLLPAAGRQRRADREGRARGRAMR